MRSLEVFSLGLQCCDWKMLKTQALSFLTLPHPGCAAGQLRAVSCCCSSRHQSTVEAGITGKDSASTIIREARTVSVGLCSYLSNICQPRCRRGWKVKFSFLIFIARLEREMVVELGQSAVTGRDFKSSKSFYIFSFLRTSVARVNSQAQFYI